MEKALSHVMGKHFSAISGASKRPSQLTAKNDIFILSSQSVLLKLSDGGRPTILLLMYHIHTALFLNGGTYFPKDPGVHKH